jgi:hypothetical protein
VAGPADRVNRTSGRRRTGRPVDGNKGVPVMLPKAIFTQP